MSETKHSPGPWRVKIKSGRVCVIADKAPGEYRSGFQYKLVADCGSTNQREANARLIAAAPDLLAELQDAAAHCEACDGKGNAYTHEDETQVGCAPGSSRIDCPACIRWRAAIARATGAAP
jgi:hypothetical protein